MKKYGDYLTVEDISSPFEAFGMTRGYKQNLVNTYNDSISKKKSSDSEFSANDGVTHGTWGNGGSYGNGGNGGMGGVNAGNYNPGKFSYNTNLTLPEYKNTSKLRLPSFYTGDKFDAPDYVAPDLESQLGETPTFKVDSYSAPSYVAPEYNEMKVKRLTQEQLAPAVRGLRSALQRVASKRYDNPNVGRMTLRDALAGYGQGLQSAYAGASATARNLYNEEYSREADAAKTNFTAQAEASKTSYLAGVEAAKANFNAQYDKYKMKWEDLSEAARLNYTTKYNEALQNWQSTEDARKLNFQTQSSEATQNFLADQEASKLNFQNLTDAKKLAYTAGLDVAKTNFATNADWMKTQYTMENQKAMQSYDNALKKYAIDSQKQSQSPGVVMGNYYGSTDWGQDMKPKVYDTSYLSKM